MYIFSPVHKFTYIEHSCMYMYVHLQIQSFFNKKDIYSFKVFDINAKCTFERTSATGLFEKLEAIDLEKQGKIIAIKSSNENSISAHKLANYYEKFDYIIGMEESNIRNILRNLEKPSYFPQCV